MPAKVKIDVLGDLASVEAELLECLNAIGRGSAVHAIDKVVACGSVHLDKDRAEAIMG